MYTNVHIKLFEDFAKELNLKGLKFSETVRDYHSGQHYMTATATLNDKQLGYVDYSIYNKEIHIDIVEVDKDYRRNGIATKLFNYIRLQNAGMKLIPGMSTLDGHIFYQEYQKKYIK